ncbi:MAG TPA: hypothetical protein PK733_04130 [Clostridiales bacterium]|nr:hypothetical protein [Clostridiales bacterium]
MSISVLEQIQNKEKDAWIAIYESRQTNKILREQVVAVEEHGDAPCLVVFCMDTVKVIIPLALKGGMTYEDEKKNKNMLYAMIGSNIEYVIEEIDREGEIAVGNRAKAMGIRRKEIPELEVGQTITCNILAVGRKMVIAEYYGMESKIGYQDITWSFVSDLRNIISVGNELKCVITEIDAENEILNVSIKKAIPDPYINIAKRYVVGGKYIGVVSLINEGFTFVRLPGGVDARCPHPGWTNLKLNTQDKVQLRIRHIRPEKRSIIAVIDRLIERNNEI